MTYGFTQSSDRFLESEHAPSDCGGGLSLMELFGGSTILKLGRSTTITEAQLSDTLLSVSNSRLMEDH